jgi:hypothetical protein
MGPIFLLSRSVRVHAADFIPAQYLKNPRPMAAFMDKK